MQTAFYYNGIGTRQDGTTVPLLGRLYSAGRRVVNLALAPTFSDVQQILDEAARDLAEACEPGDRIAIFGFSRGAALARKFASMLLEADDHRTVSFLGLFDTVTAMGGLIGGDIDIEHGPLHERVQRAAHVLAIDEDRVAFAPTLIDGDTSERVREVWFAGVHGDVRGGYWNDGLSDLALAFMMDCCKEALGDEIAIGDGAGIDAPNGQGGVEIAADDIALEPRFDAPMHAHTSSRTALFERDVRSVEVQNAAADALPILHLTVKLRLDGVPGYRLPALRNLDFRLWLDPGKVSPPIRGIGGLRRYRLPWKWRLRRWVRGFGGRSDNHGRGGIP